MSADAKSKLFTPFYQENQKSTKLHGGTGLGLVICKRLINMMGGELLFNSEQGVGSKFYFSLPLEFVSIHNFEITKIDTRVYLLDGNTYSRRAIRNNLFHMGIKVFAVDRYDRLIDCIVSNKNDVSDDDNSVVMVSLPPDYSPDNFCRDFYDEIISRYDLHFDFEPPTDFPMAKSIIITAAFQPKVSIKFQLSGKTYCVIIPPTYLHGTDKESSNIRWGLSWSVRLYR